MLQAKRGAGGPIRLHGSPLTAPRNRLKPYVLKPPNMKDLCKGQKKLGVPDFYPVPANAPEERIDKTTVTMGHCETFGIEQPTDEHETFKKVFTCIQEKDFRDKVAKLRDMAQRSKSQALMLPAPKSAVQFPTQIMQNDESLRKKWIGELSYPLRQDDLQPGTPSFTPLRELAATVPHGYKGSTLLDMLVENQVPMLRATWYVKVIYLNTYHPNKPNSGEQRSTNWTQILVKYLDGLIPPNLRVATPATPAAPAAAVPAGQKRPAAAAVGGEVPAAIAVDRASFLKWAYATRLLLWQSAKGLLDPRTIHSWFQGLLASMSGLSTPADEEHLSHYAFPLLPHLLPELCRSHTPFRPFLQWLLDRARRLVVPAARGAAVPPSSGRVASVVRLCLRYVSAAVPDVVRWPEGAELRSLTARVEAMCSAPALPPPPPAAAPAGPSSPAEAEVERRFQRLRERSLPPRPLQAARTAPLVIAALDDFFTHGDLDRTFKALRSVLEGSGYPLAPQPAQCLLDTACRWALALPAAPGGPPCATEAHPLRAAVVAAIARRHADALCAAAIETAPPGASPSSQAEYALARLHRDLVRSLLRLAPLATGCTDRVVGLFGELARRGLFSRERHRRELILAGMLEPPEPPEGSEGELQIRLLEEIPSFLPDGSPDLEAHRPSHRLPAARCRVYAHVSALALDDGDSPAGAYLAQWERSVSAAYDAFAAERERRLAIAAGPAGAAGETPRSSALEAGQEAPRDAPPPPATDRRPFRFVYQPPPPPPPAPGPSATPGTCAASSSPPATTALSRPKDLGHPAAAIAALTPAERFALSAWTLAHVQRSLEPEAEGAAEWPPWELPTEEQLRGAFAVVEACGDFAGLLTASLDLLRRSAGSPRYDRLALALARRLLPAFAARALLPDLLRAAADKVRSVPGGYHLRDPIVALASYVLVRYDKVEGVKAWLAASDSAPAELKRELTAIAKQAAAKPDRGAALLELDFFPQTVASAAAGAGPSSLGYAAGLAATVQEPAHVLCPGLAWSEGGDMVGEGLLGSVETAATMCRDNPAGTAGLLQTTLRQFFNAYEAAPGDPERHQSVLLCALWLTAVDASCRAAGPGRALPPHAQTFLGGLVQPSVPWGAPALQGRSRPLDLSPPARSAALAALLAALAARAYCRFEAVLSALLPPAPSAVADGAPLLSPPAAASAVACLRALLTGDGASLHPAASHALEQEAPGLRAARLAEGLSPGLLAALASLAAIAFAPAPIGGTDSPAACALRAVLEEPVTASLALRDPERFAKELAATQLLPLARARHAALYCIDRCGPLALPPRAPTPPAPAVVPVPPTFLPSADSVPLVGTPSSVPPTPPVGGDPAPAAPAPAPVPAPAPAKPPPAVGTVAWVRERMRAVVGAVTEWNVAARGAELKLLVLEWRELATAASSATSSPSSPPPATPVLGCAGSAAGEAAGDDGASTPEGQVGECVVREALRRPEQAPLLEALLARHVDGDGVGLAVRREAGRRLGGLLQRHKFDLPSLRRARAVALGGEAGGEGGSKKARGPWRGWKPWVRAELYGALLLLLGRAADTWLEDRERATLAEQLAKQLQVFTNQHARAVGGGHAPTEDEAGEDPAAERECLFVAQQAAALRVRLVQGLLPMLREQRPAAASGGCTQYDNLAHVQLRLLACPPVYAELAPAPAGGAAGQPLASPCSEALDLLHAMLCTPSNAPQSQRDADTRLTESLQAAFVKMQYPPSVRARLAHVIGYTPPASIFGRFGPPAGAAAAPAPASSGPPSARGTGIVGSPPPASGGRGAHGTDSPASPSGPLARQAPGGPARTSSPLANGRAGAAALGPAPPLPGAGPSGKGWAACPVVDPWTVLEDYPDTHVSLAQLGAIRRRPRKPLTYVAIG